MRTKIIFSVFILGAITIVCFLAARHRGTEIAVAAPVAIQPPTSAAPPLGVPVAVSAVTPETNFAPVPNFSVTNVVATARHKKKHNAKPKDEIKDPAARVALSSVGADPEAEAYWTGAINDPNLSATERQGLIEDLNEDGLTDPHQLAEADVPLIMNRLELIEEQAPYAMDHINRDAFLEAEKDLLNLLNGKTVK